MIHNLAHCSYRSKLSQKQFLFYTDPADMQVFAQ